METKQIVQEVFNNMGKMYESIFETYYPSHKSNGFTERNLTFYFTHFYLQNFKKLSDIIIWQEAPLKEGGHFDTLIIDKVNEIIFIVEAKRLQNEKKGKSIEADYDRILEKFNKIANFDNYSDFNKYALLLTDIWIPKKKIENKLKIKNNFLNFNFDLNIEKSIENRSIKIKNIINHSKQEYWIMYNLYKIS